MKKLLSVTHRIRLRPLTTSLLTCALTLSVAPAHSSEIRTSTSSFDSLVITSRMGLPGDHDGDGILDEDDVDDDNDTISDDNEGSEDTDLDGIPNFRDLDSDNDGIPDMVEAIKNINLLNALDDLEQDNQAFDGLMDTDVAVGTNGLADMAETAPDSGAGTTGFHDTDGDGVLDQLDRDSDNDGIPDLRESECTEFDEPRDDDVDRNGALDFFIDENSDGYHDQVSLPRCGLGDRDLDSAYDFRDTDSDNDGLSDALETFNDDADGDGVIDRFKDENMDGLDDNYPWFAETPADLDGDGLPNYLDLDSDGDGTTDAQAAGLANNPPSDPDDPGSEIPTDMPTDMSPETPTEPNAAPPDDAPNEAPDVAADDTPGNAQGNGVESPANPDLTDSQVPDQQQLSDSQEEPLTNDSTSTVTIGREGAVLSGCSISNAGKDVRAVGFDPLLLLLLLSGLIQLMMRRPARRAPPSAQRYT